MAHHTKARYYTTTACRVRFENANKYDKERAVKLDG